ncbi:MAG: tetratricopeptide repeat protein [Candidatus Neomarinimicrobiota bacterium]
MFSRCVLFCFMVAHGICNHNELEKGIALYDQRLEGSVKSSARPEPITNAISHFQYALKNTATETDAALYLLKSYYFRGKYVHKDKEKQKLDFSKGKELGEKYIKKYPDSAPFQFWYLVNLGSWSEVYGIITAAREGVADLMKEHSEIIISLDPEYENGGGYFMLGAVHFKSPYIPFFLSWPDNNKAITYLTKALTIGDAVPNQKVYLAQALYKDGQKNRAIDMLKEVANMQPLKEEIVRDWEQIELAKQLLLEYR